MTCPPDVSAAYAQRAGQRAQIGLPVQIANYRDRPIGLRIGQQCAGKRAELAFQLRSAQARLVAREFEVFAQ
jgi:hypothetical protein